MVARPGAVQCIRNGTPQGRPLRSVAASGWAFPAQRITTPARAPTAPAASSAASHPSCRRRRSRRKPELVGVPNGAHAASRSWWVSLTAPTEPASRSWWVSLTEPAKPELVGVPNGAPRFWYGPGSVRNGAGERPLSAQLGRSHTQALTRAKVRTCVERRQRARKLDMNGAQPSKPRSRIGHS